MSLIVKFDEYQIQQIAIALEDLFILQDRPCTEGKKSLLTRELEGLGYPFKAILQGIKSLHSEDLRSIKLITLKNAISKFITSDYATNCPHCKGEGSVCLKDLKTGMYFAMGCKCSSGDGISKAQGLVRWNGMEIHPSNGRDLKYMPISIQGNN